MPLDTRRTRHGECVCVCRRRDRGTHDEVGGARSARRLARDSALARWASPVSALTEPSRRCNARGAVMSLGTRRTRHGECVCVCRRRDRRTHDEDGGARSARRLARGSALARWASPVPALTEPSRRCNARERRGNVTRHTAHTTRRVRVRVSTEPSRRCNARGAVMSLGTRRTRHGECVCVCRRRDRRTHDEVGGARSARRLARGSALARRASPVSALTEPSRRCNARGAVMSLDTRRTRHGECVCVCRRRDRRTHDEVGGARSARQLARNSALARRASPVSALTEPSRRCNARERRGNATRHTAHTTRRVRVRVSTARSAHARRGRRRSVGSTTRSRLGARSVGVAGVGSDRAEPAMQRKRRGDVTRHTAHTTRRVRVRVSTARSAHARRSRRRSVGTATRSRLGARSVGVAGAGSDRAEPAMQRKREAR